ncbi:MAG: SEC-C domain-containing protein [Myxococcales bacterium]|nr:SEC-C domain-containing protein [Myxococcales bacterium]
MALSDWSLLDDPRLDLEGEKAEWIAATCHELPELLEAMYVKNRGRHPGTGAQATSKKVDRNAPCPCGSGKKYKKCCGAA